MKLKTLLLSTVLAGAMITGAFAMDGVEKAWNDFENDKTDAKAQNFVAAFQGEVADENMDIHGKYKGTALEAFLEKMLEVPIDATTVKAADLENADVKNLILAAFKKPKPRDDQHQQDDDKDSVHSDDDKDSVHSDDDKDSVHSDDEFEPKPAAKTGRDAKLDAQKKRLEAIKAVKAARTALVKVEQDLQNNDAPLSARDVKHDAQKQRLEAIKAAKAARK